MYMPITSRGPGFQGRESLCRPWEPNPSLLQEHHVLFISEPCLQPPS